MGTKLNNPICNHGFFFSSFLSMIIKAILFSISFAVISAETLTPANLIQLARPSVPVVSPNGALAVYAQSIYNITESKVCINEALMPLLNVVVFYIVPEQSISLERERQLC